jgi:formylglycine-generating enzyme required for sulfatase activity
VMLGDCQLPTDAAFFNNSTYYNYPVVYVNWFMANSYCQWRDARLPTEAEWEKAARGIDQRTYPWGENLHCTRANYAGCIDSASPVGSYELGRSPYGIYEMGGNVFEWVSSAYVLYPYSVDDGREESDSFGNRVIRGGSWFAIDYFLRTTARGSVDPSRSSKSWGFRCAKYANP